MDYELFQSDDDEEILSAFLQATEPAQQPNHAATNKTSEQADLDASVVTILPEFNCSGQDTLKDTQFHRESFLRNGYALNEFVVNTEVDLSGLDFEPGQQQVRSVMAFLMGEACKNVQKLYTAVAGQQHLHETNAQSGWYKVRQQVTHCYHLLLHDSHLKMEWSALCQPIEYLRELLNNNLDAALWRVLYFAENAKGNKCNSPAYHLYHGVLEWRFLDLCLVQKHELMTGKLESQQQFLAQLERFLDELVLCASFYHSNKNSAELLHSSAFMCRCIKECWLLLQRLLPMWLLNLSLVVSHEQANFWSFFSQAMQRYKAQIQQQHDNTVALLACHELHAWLRLSLVHIDRYSNLDYNESFTSTALPSADVYQTASCLKEFLSCQPEEQQRRVYLCLLAPLQLQWCHPSSDVLCHTWEYLNRLLNCNFNTNHPQQLPQVCASGSAYVERYRSLLAKSQLDDLNLSSFTLYALLLGKTLQLMSILGTGSQIQKVLGRIFSKFSASKLLALNEAGIHHVIELFLCLLLSHADFKEIAPKLREMLLCLALDKLPPGRRLIVAKGHMALLLLHAEHCLSFGNYVDKLLAQLAAIQYDTDVATTYAASLVPVFEQAEDFLRGEQQLLAPWLTHYIERSGQAAQERVWQALHLLFKRLRTTRAIAGNANGVWEALQQHVLPMLRIQYSSGHSIWLPKLAADFCSRDENLLQLFLEDTEPVNNSASVQLLLHALAEKSTNITSTVIIKVWIKSLVLLTPQHEAVIALKLYVLQLPEFQSLNINAVELEEREPLCAFFGALGRCAQRYNSPHSRTQLSHKLHSYVSNFEIWLPLERLRTGRDELSARFYNFLAIIIYNCATLAYVRSKPSCFFHTAMARFLLPKQLQTGTPPEGRLPQLMHKIFPVLLQGIGQLPYKTDTYLSWALQQLVSYWTPHFTFSPSPKIVARPYATLLQGDMEGELSHYVLQLLATHFLAVQRRQAGSHAGLAIKIIQQLILELNDTTDSTEQVSSEAQLLTILKATHVALLEHMMFVDELGHSNALVLALYRTFITHSVFQSSGQVREAFISDICTLAEKHLAHCTYFFFQMLIKLTEITPMLLFELQPFIKERALCVELKRGAGEDAGIRKCLMRFQQVLHATKSSNSDM